MVCSSLLLVALLVPGALRAQSDTKTDKTPAEILNENAGCVGLVIAKGESTNLGSGFFIADGSLFVTNFHVIEGAAQVSLHLADRQELQSHSVVAYDVNEDIAILKIEGAKQRVARLGNDDRLQVGEPIVVISNPEGLEGSISNGLISGIRHLKTRTLIQFSAPVSPGSSGGALFNLNGEVVGIVSASLEAGQNLNFAIPINRVLSLLANQKETLISSLPSKPKPAQHPRTKPNEPIVIYRPIKFHQLNYFMTRDEVLNGLRFNYDLSPMSQSWWYIYEKTSGKKVGEIQFGLEGRLMSITEHLGSYSSPETLNALRMLIREFDSSSKPPDQKKQSETDKIFDDILDTKYGNAKIIVNESNQPNVENRVVEINLGDHSIQLEWTRPDDGPEYIEIQKVTTASSPVKQQRNPTSQKVAKP